MPNGGTLTVSTQITSNSSRSLTISVQDTGCGIDKKDLPHIFDPFFSKKENGTGLGLAITHVIVEEHQGNIKVVSQSGEGTTFQIKIPINQQR